MLEESANVWKMRSKWRGSSSSTEWRTCILMPAAGRAKQKPPFDQQNLGQVQD